MAAPMLYNAFPKMTHTSLAYYTVCILYVTLFLALITYDVMDTIPCLVHMNSVSFPGRVDRTSRRDC